MQGVKTRYRSAEEMIYNVETYHHVLLNEDEKETLRGLSQKEVTIVPCRCGRKPLQGECDLTIFEVVSKRLSNYGIHLCAHLAEID